MEGQLLGAVGSGRVGEELGGGGGGGGCGGGVGGGGHQVVSVDLVQLLVKLQVETCEMSLFERLSPPC